MFGLGNSTNTFIILKAQNIGIPTEQTILVYAGFNAVAAAISYPAGALSDKLGRRNLLFAALVVFGGSYLGLALSDTAPVVALLFILYGLYQGTFRAVGKALATDLVPSYRRATGVGLYSSTVGFSALAASIWGGWLWEVMGPGATFAWGAVLALAGAVLLLSLVPSHQSVEQLVNWNTRGDQLG